MDTTDKTKSAISTSALSTPQVPFQLAQLPDLSNVYNSATNLGASVVQAGEVSALANKNEQQALDKQMATSDAVSSLTLQKGQQGNDLAQAYQQGGVNDLYKQLSGLNVEAQGLQRESQASPIQTQLESIGRGRTDAGIAPLDAAKRQDIALRSLELGQRAAIAQGNYDVAKNLADQQVNAKYAQIDAEIAARKINEEALYKNVTDPAIKKALEARMALTKKEELVQAEKRATEKAVNDLLIEAAPVAPADVIAKATEIKNKGGSAVQVAAALGKYGGDFLKNELLKEQIKTQVSNRAMDEEKLRLEKLKLKISQDKVDGTNANGKPLKVTNPEIVNLNEALTARDSVNSLVDAFINSIKQSGTQVLYGEEAGKRSALQTNLLLAMKSMEKTGALDKGTIDVLTGTIPSNEFFATEAAQVASLEQLKNTINSKADSYVNSYKGTSAELDPRTKRAYESAPINSTGNAAADDYFKKTSAALQNVNTTLSTPNAVTAGFTDNQK